MKYIVIMILVVLLLAGCTAVVEEEPEPADVDGVSTQIPDTNAPVPIETFAISPGDFETSFSTEGIKYLASEENEFGDKSSIRNVGGTSMYEANTELSFSYQPILTDTTFYLKILGYGFSQEQDNTLYSGELKSGEETIPLNVLLLHPAQEVRLQFCFGFTPDFDPLMDEELEDVICISKVLPRPENDFDVNIGDINIFGDVTGEEVTGSKSLYVQNTGKTPLTVYIYLPESDRYDISASQNTVFVLPEEKVRVDIELSYTYEGEKLKGKEYGGIYALAKACEPSKECFDEARSKKEITINIR